IDDVRIYDHVLGPQDAELVALYDRIPSIVEIPVAGRTPAQKHKLRTYFLEQQAPASMRDADAKRRAAQRELDEYIAALPTTMVMEEMPTPRPAHILLRGEYDKPGDKVGRGIPVALSSVANASDSVKSRLDFAVWLVSPENPLTPRVTVNRFWQLLF